MPQGHAISSRAQYQAMRSRLGPSESTLPFNALPHESCVRNPYMAKELKGGSCPSDMSEDALHLEHEVEEHGVLPFRLRNIEPFYELSNIHPMGKSIDHVQVELRFQSMLAMKEWKKEHWITIGIGVLAFVLGSISPEILSGGDAQKFGWDGLTSVRSYWFFQMLVSLVFWGLFAMQIWRLFPIMRVHAISLLVFWNIIMLAHIFFHKTNPSFPFGAELGDMMEGTLAILVVLFFIYYFSRAVVETRDLHVEENHVHEDVRLMEVEMAEHSLKGWGVVLSSWLSLVFISSWAGANFVAQRGGERTASLTLHILTGLISIPVFMILIWYPQRMLGTGVQVTTIAAKKAELEMDGTLVAEEVETSQCPECEAEVPIYRSQNGDISVPCDTIGCKKSNFIGDVCPSCSATTPTRYDCPQFGINAPIMDFLTDVEAW